MSARVGVGVVGLGRIGRLHARNLCGRITSGKLVRVVDAVESVARATGELCDVRWSTDLQDLLDDPAVSAVVIAAPTDLHEPMICRAAAAHKDVFCEKPLAPTLPASARALAATREAGVRLQIGFHRRFDPDLVALHDRIRRGELGDVYFYRASFRELSPPSIEYLRESGGFFMDMAIHDFDVARWLVDDIDEITAKQAAVSGPEFDEIGQPDQAVVVVRFRCGALGVIENSRVGGYGYDIVVEVVGQRGTLRVGYDDHKANVQWLTEGRTTTGRVTEFSDRFESAYINELESFTQAVLTSSPPAVSGEDAIAAYLLADAASRSAMVGETLDVSDHRRALEALCATA